MSLFRAREWWSSGGVLTEAAAELQGAALATAQLGPEGSGDIIIFGTPDGLIQIFKPQDSFRPTDVVLEYTVNEPVLEINTGKLLPGSNIDHIAVLHPLKISIYSLSSKEGHMEYGDQNILIKQYSHTLPRAAYCFVIGPFGNVKEKDFICVQSLDGMLMFFEQDLPSFNCFLPNVLLPGPLAYSNCADIFITCTSNWSIEAYSYYNLSNISETIKDKTKQNKKVTPDWEYNIGENILTIQTLQISNNSCCFILMGEKYLYCIYDNGTLKFMKSFDFEPVCSFGYLVGWYYENNARLMEMVVSSTSTLYIYEQVTLLWSCQLTFMPLIIKRAFFPNLPGAIVMATDNGEVKCCYLGTEPELFTAPPLPIADVDFDRAQKELENLQTIINTENDNSEINLISKATERDLPFSIYIDQNLEINDHCSYVTSNVTEDTEYISLKCKVEVNIKPVDHTIIEFLQVTFETNSPLLCSNSSESFTDITDNLSVVTDVFMSDLKPVSNLDICVIILFINSIGQIRVLKKADVLPLKLVCYPATPLKESKYKLTLAIDKPTIDLTELFKEFDNEKLSELGANNGVIAFTGANSTDSTVTIISAKSSQRYRIQSDDLTIMNIIINQLVMRVNDYISKKPYLHDNSKIVKFYLHGNVSIDIIKNILQNIEQHAILRQNLINAEELLDTLSLQFILVQKKLLLKYRERPPVLSEGINALLKDTHSKIVETVLKSQKYKQEIYSYGCKISSGIELIYTLSELLDMKKEEIDYFKSATSCKNLHDDFQNWEENCVPNIMHLLRFVFTKNNKDKDKFIKFDQNDSIKNYDIKKMIKYIRMLFEKVVNTQQSNDDGTAAIDRNTMSQLIALQEENVLNIQDEESFKIPEGSSYGQRKTLLTENTEQNEQ